MLPDDNKSTDNLTPEQKEVKKRLWDITKFDEDGQVKAGEVDKTQEEFLKTTKFVE